MESKMNTSPNWKIRHAELHATMRPVRMISGRLGTSRHSSVRGCSVEDRTSRSLPSLNIAVLFEDAIHTLFALSSLSERRMFDTYSLIEDNNTTGSRDGKKSDRRTAE